MEPMDTYPSYAPSPPEPESEVNFKKVIAIISLGILLLGFLYFLFSFSLVTIAASSPDNKDVVITKSVLTDIPERDTSLLATIKSGQSKTLLVRRGSYELIGRSGNYTASRVVSVKLLRRTSADLRLQPQKLVTKIGTQSMGCSNFVNDVLYSYSCSGESNVFKHAKLTKDSFSDKTPIYPIGDKKQLAVNYDNGILETVFESGEEDESYILQYRNLGTGQTTKVSVPTQRLANAPVNSRPIKNVVIDSSFQTLRFAVVLFDNSVLVFNDVTDTKPKGVEPDFTQTGLPSTSIATNVSMVENSLYVYGGREDTSIDSDDEAKEYKKYKGGFVDEYTISPAKVDKKKRVNLGKEVQGSKASVFGGNRLVLLTKSGLKVYEMNGSKLGRNVLKVPAQNYEIALSGQAILIGNDNTISLYKAGSDELQGVFYSDTVRFSSFSSNKNQVIFNGITSLNNSLSATQVYTMDLSKDQRANAPELKLPYSQKQLPIADMDFLNNLIVIKPSLASLEFIDLPAPVYDEQEFRDATEKINKQLATDGITAPEYTIVYKVL